MDGRYRLCPVKGSIAGLYIHQRSGERLLCRNITERATQVTQGSSESCRLISCESRPGEYTHSSPRVCIADKDTNEIAYED